MINMRVYHPKVGMRQVCMDDVDVDNQVVRIDGRLFSYADRHATLPIAELVLPTSYEDRFGRIIYEYDYINVRVWDIKKYPEKMFSQPHKLYEGIVTRNDSGVPVLWAGQRGDMSDKNNLVLSSLGESSIVEIKSSALLEQEGIQVLYNTQGDVVYAIY